MTRFKFPQITIENLNSMLTLLILCVQVVLLVLLSIRIGRLEKIFADLAGGNAPPAPVVVKRVPDEREWVLGPKDAKVTVVMFSDFECPYCAEAVPQVKQLLAEYPTKVRFVYRHFPLTDLHTNAFQAAEAAECAGEQGKFWEMHDGLFENQKTLNLETINKISQRIGLNGEQFNQCLDSKKYEVAVSQDIEDGKKYGVDGTPTFFVNKQLALSVDEVRRKLQEMLGP